MSGHGGILMNRYNGIQCFTIRDNNKMPWLLIAGTGGHHGRIQQGLDIVFRHRLRPKLANASTGMYGG